MPDKVTLHGIKADDITFVNHLEPNTKIRLTFRFTHNLNYAPGNNARAELSVTGEDADAPDKFRVFVKQIGYFTYPDSMKKEQVHVETFRMLFPYARATCTTVTAAAGVPPIMLPQIDISEESIYQISFRPPEKEGGSSADQQ